MTENIQIENTRKGLISELIEVLQLVTLFAIRKMNLQHVLYFTAFLTFGIGDGITGAYMMDRLGVGIESNPFARYMFMEHGFWGMAAAKMWITVILLFVVFVIQLKSYDNMYWTVNGFLIALAAGGLMAVNANLTALAGEVTHAPSEIIFAFMALVLILTETGSFVDHHTVYYESVSNAQ